MSAADQAGRGLRVIVDPHVCLGGGQCELLCPDVFEVSHIARVRVERVDPRHADIVRMTADACPSGAIRILEDDMAKEEPQP